MSGFNTPMMKQYISLKEQYPDCILFFRLGDFYEMFMDDAKIGSSVLDITLTSRDRGKDGRIPMCGVPFHAVDSYLNKLVRAGYKVAICEQLTEPGLSELVERDVVRIVTPGTILDENSLEKKENNFIVGLHLEKDFLGVAVADLSTGYFETAQFPLRDLDLVIANEVSKFNPSECVLSANMYNNISLLKKLKSVRNLNIFPFLDWERYSSKHKNFLENHFGLKSISSFGIEDFTVAQKACAGLLGYLKYTQKDKVSHVKKISLFNQDNYVEIDRSTINNLELFATLRDNRKFGSFSSVIDKTTTSAGGRMLKNWILKPLTSKEDITKRQDCVSELISETAVRTELKKTLAGIGDIERIVSRLSTGIGSPKDLIGLKESLYTAGSLKEIVGKLNSDFSKNIYKQLIDQVLNLGAYINVVLVENPPFDPKSGNLINKHVDSEIDDLRSKVNKSKDFISEMEIKERKRSGINSLKVKYNQVFGYYIEVTKSNLDLVPKDYVRKQTLVNAERFITPELKKHEEIILTAESRMKELEYTKFLEVVESILSFTKELQTVAEGIAKIDCMVSFAEISLLENYVRPVITDTGNIKIEAGRHPVVEKNVDPGAYVPNDVYLDQNSSQLLIITGPNMGGKSVFIRQVALIVLMAQMGCYVPAKSAEVSIVDKIFVRSGASDVISMGLSTFMVEMIETANILNNATSKSLIVMDEIGRGTSTYDGISIAWSVAEYLVANPKVNPKTLFATHYHELQDLEERYPNKIKNFQVTVKEENGEPVFLHKVIPGGAEHSFGVAVARLAGVPEEVCQRAMEVLGELKDRAGVRAAQPDNQELTVNTSLRENPRYQNLLEELYAVDISQTTPLQALNLLSDLKRMFND